VDEALGLLDARGAIADNGGETWFRAEIHRLRGELILARSATDRDEAQAAFDQALQLARSQQAKSLELRAAMSLARLWGENKKKAEAYELLTPIYGWFTEGFDTPDLQEAKALLDELS
jgi:predicted ATPase